MNDAFGSAHRAHASTEAVARLLKPAVSGFLMEQELRYLGEALHQPKRPFVAVLGGAKISGKIDLIEALLPKVDEILLGGAMACTFFKAMGLETGNSLVEADRVDLARHLMEKAGEKLVLPAGGVIARELKSDTETRTVARDAIPAGWAVYDIDPATERDFAARIERAGTVVWNGPMGVFETPPFDHGTLAVARAMAAATGKGAVTVVGGGDSAAAVAQAGTERQDHPRLDRRRRVARVSRGQGAARRRGAGRGLSMARSLHLRRQLEDAPRARRGPDLHRAVPRAHRGRRKDGGSGSFRPRSRSRPRARPRTDAPTSRSAPRTCTGSPRARSPASSRSRWSMEAGARAALVGHSERRHLFGETDEQVGRKVAAVLKAGITPLVCVGETLAEREGGRTEQVVVRQVDAVLERVPSADWARVVAGLRAGLGDRHRPERHAGRRGPGARADPVRARPAGRDSAGAHPVRRKREQGERARAPGPPRAGRRARRRGEPGARGMGGAGRNGSLTDRWPHR